MTERICPTITRRRAVRLLAAGATLLAASTASAGPPVARDASDPRWVGGAVVVPLPPPQARELLNDVGGWPKLFRDVRSLEIRRHDSGRWRASLVSATLGGHAHDLEASRTAEGVAFTIDATGLNTRGVFAVADGPSAGTSRVTFRLFAETTGVAGLFLSEQSLRKRQEGFVATYLADLQRLNAGR
ncbi:MAG TPA: hypothetical protein VFS43_21140 [Polyangiaceae bacterium]|nr:hypothetical protein [Polyangiaceae bacterium]